LPIAGTLQMMGQTPVCHVRLRRDELVSLGVCSAHVGREVHHIAPKPSRLELHRRNPCMCLSAVPLTDMPCTRRQVA
jgi:hypothetical protein